MKNRGKGLKTGGGPCRYTAGSPVAPRLKQGQPSARIPEPAYHTPPSELLPPAKVQGGLAMGTPSSLEPYPQPH